MADLKTMSITRRKFVEVAAVAGMTAALGSETAFADSETNESLLSGEDGAAEEEGENGALDSSGTSSDDALTVSSVDTSAWTCVSYSSHVQDVGWQSAVSDGAISGTTGQSKRLEALKASLGSELTSAYPGSIQYRSHVQDLGWESSWKSDGAVSGTVGKSKRLEAVQVRLAGEVAEHYDVYYRVHVSNVGWMDWAANGGSAGSTGLSLRVEAVQIELVAKGAAAPGSTGTPFVEAPTISYRAHVADVGWQGAVKDGATAGTTGRSKAIEALKVFLSSGVSGGVSYRLHVQNVGWQSSVSDGAVAGTTGRSLRAEAVSISLTGDAAKYFDVYYRVHSQDYGWLGWAKNGAYAGTTSCSYRMEAIQVKVVGKGADAPGSTSECYKTDTISWVNGLNVAKTTSRLVMVSVYDTSYATVSFHEKSGSYWRQIFSVSGRVGSKGIGKTKEGDKKTPTGVYTLHTPFGIQGDPGCPVGYTQVNNYHYWGGADAKYYNKLVDSSKISGYKPGNAEHLIDYGSVYNYCVAIGYNLSCTVGKGSAIFLHCKGSGATAGCVSIPESNMITVLKNLTGDAKIVIDNSSKIKSY